MKQYRQSQISIGWLVASVIALASAGTLAADVGQVNSGGRSVNEVLGRASASSPSTGIRAVTTTALPGVSEVYGRASQMSVGGGTAIGIGAMDVGDFGRASSSLAAANGKHGAGDVSVASNK